MEWDGEERRGDIIRLHERIDKSDASIAMLHEDMARVRELLEAIKGMLDAWNSAKGAVKVIYAIGTVTKWVVAVGLSISAIIYLWHNGTLPPGAGK